MQSDSQSSSSLTILIKQQEAPLRRFPNRQNINPIIIMEKYNKPNRHKSHRRGVEFVNSFNGLRNYPTYETEIHIPGKYAKVDVNLNLGTFPLEDLTDATPLEELKANLRKAHKVRVSEPKPQEKNTKRISPWGWVAVAAVVIGTSLGIGYATRKAA